MASTKNRYFAGFRLFDLTRFFEDVPQGTEDLWAVNRAYFPLNPLSRLRLKPTETADGWMLQRLRHGLSNAKRRAIWDRLRAA